MLSRIIFYFGDLFLLEEALEIFVTQGFPDLFGVGKQLGRFPIGYDERPTPKSSAISR
jgi:hypothetical protein